MSFGGDSVWKRQGAGNALSKRAFAGLVTFWTAFGLGATGVASYLCRDWEVGWPLAIGVTVVAIIGIIVAMKSDNPVVSFLGYMLVAVPFGALLGPVAALYSVASVVKVMAVTFGMVVTLGVIGAVYPKSLESWGIFLFGGLIILLLGMIFIPVLGMFGLDVSGAMSLWDWIGVLLFGGYVIYDMNRAMRVERTHDNAIDCAVAVYLDVVNLFIRLLRIMGGNSGD